MKRKTVDSVVSNANHIGSVWAEQLKDLAFTAFTKEHLGSRIDVLKSLADQSEALQTQMIKIINEKAAVQKEIEKMLARFKGAVKSHYGPDSSEYEQVGGTRSSERKPRTKKAKPEDKPA